MPPQPAIAGSRTFVGPSAGGEGPWYYVTVAAGPSPTLHIPDCAVGDTIAIWMLSGLTYPALVNAEVVIEVSTVEASTYMWYILIRCTSAGTVTFSTTTYSNIIAHKTASPATDAS